MPVLSRHTARPLLRIVNQKPHATRDDHADQLPTPPSTISNRSSTSAFNVMEEEDIYGEPKDSSEDEAPVAAQSVKTKFRSPRPLEDIGDEPSIRAEFKQPASVTPESRGNKRASFTLAPSSDNDALIFEEQPHKRQKMFGVINIHAPPRKSKGSFNKQTSSLQSLKRKSEEVTPAKSEFKFARGADAFEFGKTETLPEFRTPRCASETNERGIGRSLSLSRSSSPLSEAPSRDDEDIRNLNLPEPKAYRSQCATCGEEVDVLLREEFENQFTNGKTILNYKWQQRFCRWHKEHNAKRIRVERGYPEVNWDGLERRMRRHHKYLKDLVSGLKSSYYRDQLSEKIKERSKTAIQVLSSDGAKRGASVGYYGPRGERVMTEHIINHLSDKLREQSSRDKLVAAAGVSGGVSGFVQAVLVPELAEQLVMEDMKVSKTRAREVITESAELGELLYPDVDDKVIDVVEV